MTIQLTYPHIEKLEGQPARLPSAAHLDRTTRGGL